MRCRKTNFEERTSVSLALWNPSLACLYWDFAVEKATLWFFNSFCRSLSTCIENLVTQFTADPTLACEKSFLFAHGARPLVAYVANLPTFSTNSRENACHGPIARGLRYVDYKYTEGEGPGVYSGETVPRP